MYSPRTRLLVAVTLAGIAAACNRTGDSPAAPDTALEAKGVEAAFLTAEPAQARALAAGVALSPLATVGDIMPGSGLPLAPIPDGIGVHGGGRYLTLLLNHELGAGGVPLAGGGSAFHYSRVSRFTIDTKSLEILDHRYLLDGSEGYERLCSAEWVDARDGFPGGYFFTGEEVGDGLQLAIDRQGNIAELPWVGRYNHENQIAVPGFPGHVVILNFDDNGGSGTGRTASRSELYMYVAANGADVLTGRGQLYAFASDAVAHPGELTPGQTIAGHWVPVPDAVAQNAAALQQFAYDEVVFPFVRLEDGFHDKRAGAGPAAYFFDTGRGSIRDADGTPWDPWGSIYRLTFNDPSDPAGGAVQLTLLSRSTGPDQMWASPDNGDMNADGVVMLQEDPANDPFNRAAQIWQLRLAADGTLVDPVGTAIAEATDADCVGDAVACELNEWETSGIVDVSEWFGPNTWIFDVQASRKPVPSLDLVGANGQLLFLRLAGH